MQGFHDSCKFQRNNAGGGDSKNSQTQKPKQGGGADKNSSEVAEALYLKKLLDQGYAVCNNGFAVGNGGTPQSLQEAMANLKEYREQVSSGQMHDGD